MQLLTSLFLGWMKQMFCCNNNNRRGCLHWLGPAVNYVVALALVTCICMVIGLLVLFYPVSSSNSYVGLRQRSKISSPWRSSIQSAVATNLQPSQWFDRQLDRISWKKWRTLAHRKSTVAPTVSCSPVTRSATTELVQCRLVFVACVWARVKRLRRVACFQMAFGLPPSLRPSMAWSTRQLF